LELNAGDDGNTTRKLGGAHVFNLSRIAVGSQVFSHQCVLKVMTSPRGNLSLYFSSGPGPEHPVSQVKICLKRNSSLEDIFYFFEDEAEWKNDEKDKNSGASSDEMISFIAMRVDPNQDTLIGFRDSLAQQYSMETSSSAEFARQFIVMELRNENDFRLQIPKLREDNACLKACLDDDSHIRRWSEAAEFCHFLLEDTKQQRLEEMEIENKRRTRSSRTKGKSQDDTTLLVYPFVGGMDIERAADGLLEAAENTVAEEKGLRSAKELQEESTTGRSHFLSIRREDRERLEQGEFLNDTLVDFWMRWYVRADLCYNTLTYTVTTTQVLFVSFLLLYFLGRIWRHESPTNSLVHFFTSHFYTTIRDDNPEAVTSWTKKKKIDIFSKRLIFLPINATLHWSLCVVVNPGNLRNALVELPPTPHTKKRRIIIDDDQDFSNKNLPCILFFDSLKAHRKAKVSGDIRKWLNAEYSLRFEKDDAPFNNKTMPVYTPRGKLE
jgi:hypothetical protein